MDQPGNNHLLPRAPQVARPGGATGDRMRDLLTRTVADHVADEWFTADAIEMLRRRLDILERQTRDLAQNQHASGPAALPGVSEVPEAPAASAHPGQSLAGIAATLDGLAASLGALDGTHSGTDKRVRALDNRLERLDERLDDQYDRVTSLDRRLGSADTKIEALTGQVEETRADLSGRLASLEEVLYTLAEVLLRPAVRVPHALENGYPSA